MNCQEFEMLLADAVGGELPTELRSAFDAHACDCVRCRREYESLRAAIADARSLPPPARISIARVGEQLILSEIRETRIPAGSWASPWMRAALRYAASLVLAFAAGYAAHSSFGPAATSPVPPGEGPGVTASATADARLGTLQLALADAHAKNPGKSDLTKGLIAVFDVPRR